MALSAGPRVDAITLEVMRNALYSIADEMTMTLVRTARSTNIKDRRDCSCGIYLPNGDLIAQSEMNTPVHLGTMAGVVRTVLEFYPPEQLGPGDTIAMSLSWPGPAG